MVLSRKSGESIVIGPMAFTNLIEAVPSPPVAGGTEPSSSGGGRPPTVPGRRGTTEGHVRGSGGRGTGPPA